MSKLLQTLKIAGKDFMEDRCMSQAAGLSFYAVTAIPPLVVIILSVIGLIFGTQESLERLTREVALLFGQSMADLIKEVGEDRTRSQKGLATVIGFGTLMIAASGFFGQLQDSLNQAWEVRVKPDAGWMITIKKRLLSMTAVLGTAFLLLISLLLSALTSALSSKLEAWFGLNAESLTLLQIPISLVVIGSLFTAIFKVLPDAKVTWKHALKGGLFTTILFVLGKFAFGLYLGNSSPGEAYGAAGSLVLLLFWIYFSTNVLLFGAELTQAIAKIEGHRVQPEAHAEQFEEVVVESEPDESPTAPNDT